MKKGMLFLLCMACLLAAILTPILCGVGVLQPKNAEEIRLAENLPMVFVLLSAGFFTTLFTPENMPLWVGKAGFMTACAGVGGYVAVVGGMAPDLREALAELSIVLIYMGGVYLAIALLVGVNRRLVAQKVK